MSAPQPAVGPRPRRTVLAELLREALRLDRTQSDPVVALRNAIGIAAPLAVGELRGDLAAGLGATIGAIQAAFADRPGPYRLRMLRMLGTSLAAAVTSALAIVASGSAAASVGLLFVLALVAGLLLAAGPSATQVGIAGVAAALVLGHLASDPASAPHVALLVFVGGAVQTVLAVAAWPLRRHRPERVALAGLYHQLAAAARTPQGSKAAPPASDTLTEVRKTLYGLGHDHGPSVEAYRVLLDEAERIRRELVIVIGFAERLGAEGEPIRAGLVRECVTASGDVLAAVAAALETGHALDDTTLAPARQAVAFTVARLDDDTGAARSPTRRAAAARLRALAGQLRAAVQSTGPGASEGRDRDASGDAGTLADALATVVASLAPDSAVVRHAVRIAALVAGTDLVVRLAGIERGYWVSLTVLVVLRPDFGATLQRAVLRTLGTVVGLLAATVLVHWIPGGPWWQVALIAGFAFGMRLAGPGNFGLSAVALSGLVVVLLEISGVSAGETLVSRAVATLVGGALAVLATLALPGWERSFVRVRAAELLTAYRHFVLAMLDPATSAGALQDARAANRLARTNAQASVDRARAEPVHSALEIDVGTTVLAHSHRIIAALLAVDAVRVPAVHTSAAPQLRDFLAACAALLGLLADAVQTGARPATTRRRLRPLQQHLAAALEQAPDRVGGAANAAVVIDATDRITNALDTLDGALRRIASPGTALVR